MRNARRLVALSAAVTLFAASRPTVAGTLYFDGNGTDASGNPPTSGVDGSGTWDNSTPNWWTGTAYQNWNAAGGQDIADFRGTAGTALIADGETVAANRLVFNTHNQIIAGGAGSLLNLTSSTPIIDISPLPTTSASKATISAVISGSNGFAVNATTNTVNQQLVLNGNNSATLTGGVTLNGGTTSATAFGAFGSGAITVNNGAQLDINTAGTNTWTNNVNLNGLFGGDGFGAMRLRVGTSTFAGTITLQSNSRISGSNNLNASGLISGKITGNFNLELGGPTATTGSGVKLSNTTNDWTGDTIINAPDNVANTTNLVFTFQPMNNNVLPHGNGKGNLIMNGGSTTSIGFAVLNLFGAFTTTVNGLSTTGTGGRVAISGVAGAGKLIVGDNNADGDFGGLLGTGGSQVPQDFEKIGTGTQILRTNSELPGTFTISGGVLRVESSAFASSGLQASTTAGSNIYTLTSGTTANLRVGDTARKDSGTSTPNPGKITAILNSTQFAARNNANATAADFVFNTDGGSSLSDAAGLDGSRSNLVLNGGVLGLGDYGDFKWSVGPASTLPDPFKPPEVKFNASGGFAAFGAPRNVRLGMQWDDTGSLTSLVWDGTNGFLTGANALILGSDGGPTPASASDNTVDFQNPIDFNGAVRTVRADNGTAAVDGILSGALTNGGLTKAGTGTLRVSAAAYSGATTASAGTLQFDQSFTTLSDMNASGGTIELTNSATIPATKIIKTDTVNISGGGKINLQNNKMAVVGGTIGTPTGGDYSGISGFIQDGRAGGAWNGSGIMTSRAEAAAGTTGIGVRAATAGQVFGGETLAAGDVMVMYTYVGDATLDGVIDGDDFAAIDAGFSSGPVSYATGDFNYSGNIDADDYWYIDRNYSKQSSSPLAPSSPVGVTAVPEPASMAVVGIAAASLFRRRTRNRR